MNLRKLLFYYLYLYGSVLLPRHRFEVDAISQTRTSSSAVAHVCTNAYHLGYTPTSLPNDDKLTVEVMPVKNSPEINQLEFQFPSMNTIRERIRNITGGNAYASGACERIEAIVIQLYKDSSSLEQHLYEHVIFSPGFKIYVVDYDKFANYSTAGFYHNDSLKSIIINSAMINNAAMLPKIRHEFLHAFFRGIPNSSKYQIPLYGTKKQRDAVKKELESLALDIKASDESFRASKKIATKFSEAFSKIDSERLEEYYQLLKDKFPNFSTEAFEKLDKPSCIVLILSDYFKTVEKANGSDSKNIFAADLLLEEYMAHLYQILPFPVLQQIVPKTYNMLASLINDHIHNVDFTINEQISDDMFSEKYMVARTQLYPLHHLIFSHRDRLGKDSDIYFQLLNKYFNVFKEALGSIVTHQYFDLYQDTLDTLEYMTTSGYLTEDMQQALTGFKFQMTQDLQLHASQLKQQERAGKSARHRHK